MLSFTAMLILQIVIGGGVIIYSAFIEEPCPKENLGNVKCYYTIYKNNRGVSKQVYFKKPWVDFTNDPLHSPDGQLRDNIE